MRLTVVEARGVEAKEMRGTTGKRDNMQIVKCLKEAEEEDKKKKVK